MKDIIRVLLQFKVLKRIEINFVEASPFLQKEQQENIRNLLKQHDIWYDRVTRRLTYKEMKNAPLSLEKGGLDTFAADPNFARCERFIANRDDIVFNWYYSYEGFLAHNEQKLKKNKSKATLSQCLRFSSWLMSFLTHFLS